MNNNIKYASKKVKDKQKRKLYNCVRVSIVAGCVYIVALATGFVLANKNRSNISDEVIIENGYEDDNTFSKFNKFNYPGYDNYYEILSLSKADLQLYNGLEELQAFDIKCTPLEFAELIGENEVTYEDCINALLKNHSIDDEIKCILKDAIRNISLQLQSNNIPLATLKYNLSNLKIKYVLESEKYDYSFNPFECCLYINEDYATSDFLNKYIIIKNALGYGMINAYTRIDGKKVLCSTSNYYYIMDSIPQIIKLGKTFENGFAEIIASIGRGDVIDCSDPMLEHSEDAYLFQIINNLCDMLLSDYAANGYFEIVDKLSSNPEFVQMLYCIKELDMQQNDRLTVIVDMLCSYINVLYNNVQQSDSMTILEKKNRIVSAIIEICDCNSDKYTIISGHDSMGIAPDTLIHLLNNYINDICQEEVITK